MVLQKVAYPSQPLDLMLYWPRLYGYHKLYNSVKGAQCAAWKSREGFRAIFAYVDFLIFSYPGNARLDPYEHLNQAGIPISVVDLIRSWRTVANTWRVGVFVYPYCDSGASCSWIHDLK